MTFTVDRPYVDQPTPCYLKHDLFESTYAYDQAIAKRLCLGEKARPGIPAIPACPILEQCKGILAQARELATPGGGPEGTWAGQAIGGNTPGRKKKAAA